MPEWLWGESQFFAWVVLPGLIFLARVMDVSLGTLRLIFITRGMKVVAPLIGFFEVLIWLLAIGQIFANLRSPVTYLAYAGGFAAGNAVGMLLEERIAVGLNTVRIITQANADALIARLKDRGFGVTSLPARGSAGEVSLIYCVVRRRELPRVMELVESFNPRAFVSVEDVRMARGGVLPPAAGLGRRYLGWLGRLRKGK